MTTQESGRACSSHLDRKGLVNSARTVGSNPYQSMFQTLEVKAFTVFDAAPPVRIVQCMECPRVMPFSELDGHMLVCTGYPARSQSAFARSDDELVSWHLNAPC